MGKKYLLNKYYGSLEENYDEKKKITCFLKNYIAFLFTFFEKVRAIYEFRY